MTAGGQSHVVTGMGSGSGCSLDVPQTPPSTHPGGWSQESGTIPQHDAGGGVWDFLFPDERRQGPGGSGSDEVANAKAEDGSTSSVMKCKGVYRITVTGAARHGRGCCMGT